MKNDLLVKMSRGVHFEKVIYIARDTRRRVVSYSESCNEYLPMQCFRLFSIIRDDWWQMENLRQLWKTERSNSIRARQ